MKYTKEDLQVILLEFHQPSVFFQHPHMLCYLQVFISVPRPVNWADVEKLNVLNPDC